MTTSFEALPVIDLSPLRSEHPTAEDIHDLGTKLHDVFTTTGFAYLVNAPLSFSHDDVFDLAGRFFRLSDAEKSTLAKKTFVHANSNTYRGYFPPQPGQTDNLKEGFEIGRPQYEASPGIDSHVLGEKFNLNEPNVWPAESRYPDGRARLEKLHAELQALSCVLLSLLGSSLGKPPDFFAPYLPGSVSTLRLLHYPPQGHGDRTGSNSSSSDNGSEDEPRLCCTPHTDSGILTLLHQDRTGGLEVLNAAGAWVPAPYVSGSIVVNIGDLLSRVSGGRFVATMHRVRASSGSSNDDVGETDSSGRRDEENVRIGRLSVPFFFEPGEDCLVRSVDGSEGIIYGEHVRRKMGTWVEFQDQMLVAQPPPAGIPIETRAA